MEKVLEILDELATDLTNYDHIWTDLQKAKYEEAVEYLKTCISQKPVKVEVFIDGILSSNDKSGGK